MRSPAILALVVFILNHATCEETEDAVYLTNYIVSGQLELAKEKLLVKHEEIKNITSYAGFVTIDKTRNANTFFWFFPSQSNPKTDPVLLWFEGGYGITVSRVIFMYNGPFYVNDRGNVFTEKFSFISNHSVIYIDHPVGIGYSHSDDESGHLDFDQDVINFLDQFFKVFSDFKNNDFFIGGDSYGGRHAVTTALKIKNCNKKGDCSVNLKGVLIGNGAIDMEYQELRSEYMYDLGLIDEAQRNTLISVEQKRNEWRKVYFSKNQTVREEARKSLPGPAEMPSVYDLIPEVTGLDHPMSILYEAGVDKAKETVAFASWLQKKETRRALHVGNASFSSKEPSSVIKSKLLYDLEISAMSALEEVLSTYKVLIYNGQLDMIFPYQSTINMIKNLKWSGVEEFKSATRKIWHVKGKVAGYWRAAGNLTEVLVRKAGHIVPLDKFLSACKLIDSFTHGKQL